MPGHLWQLAHDRSLDVGAPRIVAILNVTPDSFFDGGRLPTPSSAVERAGRAIDEGASMLDIGGESTRPGAMRIDANEQIRRVIPAIRAIRAAGGELARVPISVDTTRAAVAREALRAGADAVNDVSGGTEEPRLLEFVAEFGAGLVLMHRLTTPERDSYSDEYRQQPAYGDAVHSVRAFLEKRLAVAIEAGVDASNVVLDPGLGFGKSVGDNLALIRRTGELCSLGRPVLSGLSRKSFVGRVSLGRESDPAERLAGTLAASALHLAAGARLFRVHDVAAHAEALRLAWAAIEKSGPGDVSGP